MSIFNLSERGESNVSINIGGLFTTMLTILFIGLKLTGYIDWSWVWVLSPLWIPLVLGMAILLGALLIAAVIAVLGALYDALS